ncbi:MAG: hypothetical protein ABWX62_09190 [Microterricola sp.]
MKPRRALSVGIPRLPDPTGVDTSNPEAIRSFLVSLTSTVATQLQRRPPLGTSQDKRMFTAPDGKVWAVSVDETGAVISEPVGSTQPKAMPPV